MPTDKRPALVDVGAGSFTQAVAYWKRVIVEYRFTLCQHNRWHSIILVLELGSAMDGGYMTLRKAGGNWVTEDNFFDRETELEILTERVGDQVHTLLVAQRRMGKTSLVRELQRRLGDNGALETLFVDLEAASTVEDAITELAIQARSLKSTSQKLKDVFTNVLKGFSENFEEIEAYELRIKFRAGIDSASWQSRGDQIFTALADCSSPVNLAIDELPIFVNRLLKDTDGEVTREGRLDADLFLSWLRRNCQTHQRRVSVIVSGSIGLEPVLHQAGLDAHANHLQAFQLKPWSPQIAIECLSSLANSYDVNLPFEVRHDMCKRLRCCIPHHVQLFFDQLHNHLRLEGRTNATVDDVAIVYHRDLVGVRGQVHLEHYQSRLKMVLSDERYGDALEILTQAAINNGMLTPAMIEHFLASKSQEPAAERQWMTSLLYVLQHDGYLERVDDGWRFVSGLLEDWWRSRYQFLSTFNNQ